MLLGLQDLVIRGFHAVSATVSQKLRDDDKYAQSIFNRIIGFYDKNDDPYVVPGNQYKNFVVVSIELSTTGKTSENIMAELKDAGVDISDYDAVAEYFGLDK